MGPDAYRGGEGPLFVTRAKTDHPLHKVWIEAGQQAGYPFSDDLNGYQQVSDFPWTFSRCRVPTGLLYLYISFGLFYNTMNTENEFQNRSGLP